MNMHTAIAGTPHTRTKRSLHGNRVDPVAELAQAVKNATSPMDWLRILNKFILIKFALSSKLVYETLKMMPQSALGVHENLRDELYVEFHDHLLREFDGKDIEFYGRKFMTLVQAASFTSPTRFLKAKNEVRIAYKKAGTALPIDLTERIKACEGYIKTHGSGFTGADYEAAGYRATHIGTQSVFVHPSGDSVTLYDGAARSTLHVPGKTVGGCVLTRGILPKEEQEVLAAQNRARNTKAVEERRAKAEAKAEARKKNPGATKAKKSKASGDKRKGKDKKTQ